MRNMSFSKTTEQIRNRTKFVTRRWGWWFLKAGDRVCAIEKGMGLKKGETVKQLCTIEIVSTRAEYLYRITRNECRLEGFPDMEPGGLRRLLLSMRPSEYKNYPVNRIEFKYVDDVQGY